MFLQEYEKIRMIGKGAFASVFKVRHAKLGYVRALKVCDSFIEDENDRAWQTFLSECKVLLRIGNGSHPNIVKIFQPRLIDNHAVVEMDCVEGESLHSYIKQNQFIPIEEFYRFAKQIIGALAYCHVDVYKFLMNPLEDKLEIDPNDGRKYIVSPEKEKELIKKYGVVHNDLHSGNIIRRDYDGQYILLDFGLAIQDSHCVKSSSRFDGAIEYCSPEKLENGTISTQSDIYALGILLYEMLTGRVPFPYSNGDGSTPESARSRVYQQHLHETPPPIFEFRKQAFEATHPGETYTQDYPEQLEAIIMKCLAKKPEDRFKNAKELSAAFNKLMENNSSNSSMSDLNKIKEEMEELRSQLQNENDEKNKLLIALDRFQHQPHEKVKLWRKFAPSIISLLTICFLSYIAWDKNDKANYFSSRYIAACDIIKQNGLSPDVWVNGEKEVFEGKDTSVVVKKDSVLMYEIDRLEFENKKLRQQLEKKTAQSKNEYQTLPDVQNELNRLRHRNKELEDIVKRYKDSL